MVENWNGANGFVFVKKGAEMASNRQGDQELSMPVLHLVQINLVYFNAGFGASSSFFIASDSETSIEWRLPWWDRMRPCGSMI